MPVLDDRARVRWTPWPVAPRLRQAGIPRPIRTSYRLMAAVSLAPTFLISIVVQFTVRALWWDGVRAMGPGAVVALMAATAGLVVVVAILMISMAVAVFRPRAAAATRALFLRHRRCPWCTYDLAGGRPEADGCTVCPECGGAWRVPCQPSNVNR